jgi:hypothetical protein
MGPRGIKESVDASHEGNLEIHKVPDLKRDVVSSDSLGPSKVVSRYLSEYPDRILGFLYFDFNIMVSYIVSHTLF